MRKLLYAVIVLLLVSSVAVFAGGKKEQGGSESGGESAAAQEVEVLHWWTSGGEAAALNVLKERVEAEGIEWVDSPIAGGGGENAMTALRSRVTAGNPPAAVQFLGFDMRDWAQQGVLADLSSVADEGNWSEVIPQAVQNFATYEGEWVGAPVNIHSPNWVWANLSVMEDAGIQEQPETWDEFVSALQAAEDAGYTALAHGGQPWQTATIFENLVLQTGGPEFYAATMNQPVDVEQLNSDTMVEVFRKMETLRGFVDENFSGRDWNLATAMVIEGDALFQIMGDWAKGEFFNADQTVGEDFTGFRNPGTLPAVTFNTDFFAFFELDEAKRPAQRVLAEQIMAPEFQIAFNTVKGSIPARMDVSMEEFTQIGKTAMSQLQNANDEGLIYGSLAHGHGAQSEIQGAIFDVVSQHFNQQIDSPEAAAEQLAEAVSQAQ
jgi:glucose/mannose transport system substrate-binding protein